MTINLHIERLVLDGVDTAPGQRHLLRGAIESELTRLLTEGGLAEQLTGGATLPRIAGHAIQLEDGNSAAQFGRKVAGAIYRGIGK
jgi:hypothetical protein